MRTITQRTTFPFLIAESGAASFTAAVTTSPRPARSPRSPPRGRMQESLRAPLLSATSRIVRIPIIKIAPFAQRRAWTVHPQPIALNLRFDFRRLHAHLGGATDGFCQTPPLQLA